ncbi:hypothetical protein WMF11_25905 [Sorangium sp. So ce295]|uniref:hypothetical protein n=1 Tax=Sorangium sp. So ce295 TaxID=3133295 RepID=UPI003F642296
MSADHETGRTPAGAEAGPGDEPAPSSAVEPAYGPPPTPPVADPCAVNNIGDPFRGSRVTTNVKWIERAVLDYYAALWRARWRAHLSLAIRFKAVNAALEFKYTLAVETLYVDGEKRTYNPIYAMEHVTAEQIDAFIEDLAQPGAFPEQETAVPPPPSDGSAAAPRGRRLHVPHNGRGFRD